MCKLSSYVVATTVLLVLALCPVAAKADNTALYIGSSAGCNSVCSASALFDLSGTTLTVTLTNTSTYNTLVPTDVLTAVWFDVTHTLTPGSANLNGSSVFYGSISNVGDGWGYYSGLAGGAHGENNGITSVGFGIGSGHSNFSGANNSLGGLNYGLLSAGFVQGTGQNGGVTGHGPLIQNSAQFVLSVASGFNLSQLGNTVVFQYGTSLSDQSYNGTLQPVPEPPVTTLLACSALLFGGCLRRFGWSSC